MINYEETIEAKQVETPCKTDREREDIVVLSTIISVYIIICQSKKKNYRISSYKARGNFLFHIAFKFGFYQKTLHFCYIRLLEMRILLELRVLFEGRPYMRKLLSLSPKNIALPSAFSNSKFEKDLHCQKAQPSTILRQ